MSSRVKIIVISSFVLICSVVSVLIYINVNKDPEEIVINDKSPDSRDILDTNPNSNDTPILYDFVYSTMGYKSDLKAKSFGNSYGVLVKNETLKNEDIEKGTAHILKIVPSDYFPPVSTGSIPVQFPESDWVNVKSALSNWPEDSKFIEGEYTLYIIKEANSNQERNTHTYSTDKVGVMWNGIDLNSLKYPKGWQQENISNGWSSDWVRKSPYKESIKDHYNIDVENEFFDKFRLHEIIEVESKDSDYDVRQVKVVGIDIFITVNGPAWSMSYDQMNAQLEEEGYYKMDR